MINFLDMKKYSVVWGNDNRFILAQGMSLETAIMLVKAWRMEYSERKMNLAIVEETNDGEA